MGCYGIWISWRFNDRGWLVGLLLVLGGGFGRFLGRCVWSVLFGCWWYCCCEWWLSRFGWCCWCVCFWCFVVWLFVWECCLFSDWVGLVGGSGVVVWYCRRELFGFVWFCFLFSGWRFCWILCFCYFVMCRVGCWCRCGSCLNLVWIGWGDSVVSCWRGCGVDLGGCCWEVGWILCFWCWGCGLLILWFLGRVVGWRVVGCCIRLGRSVFSFFWRMSWSWFCYCLG